MKSCHLCHWCRRRPKGEIICLYNRWDGKVFQEGKMTFWKRVKAYLVPSRKQASSLVGFLEERANGCPDFYEDVNGIQP